MKIYQQLTTTILLLTLCLLSAQPTLAADSNKNPVVNINSADKGQLANLPRVGPALAERIMEFRESNGKFKDTADLMLVRGIGEKTFLLMEPYLAISGETTLKEKVRVSRTQQKEKDQADTNAPMASKTQQSNR